MKIVSTFLFSVICICLFSCKEKKQAVSYFPKDKWKTNALRYTVLKNSPKSVAEFMYEGIDSINRTSLKLFTSLENFTFNENGDQVEYKLSTQGEQYSTITRYESDGYSTFWKDNVEDKLITDFKKVDTNQFRETHWLYPSGKSTHFITYSNNGNLVRKEEVYEDSAAEKKGSGMLAFISEYDGQHILKQTWILKAGGQKTESIYFYSAEKHLDSIVSSTGTTQHFINNKQGDPVEQYYISNADTTYHFLRTYIYDAKGNWIRMLQHRLPDRYWTGNPQTDANPYTLFVRKISYQN